jgi:hypothetical protein
MAEQTEIQIDNQNKKIAVFIEGDKSAFVSKSAVDKFKQAIKTNPLYNLSELVSKYVKPGFNIELLSDNNMEWKFQIINKPVIKQQKEKTEREQRREVLRAKLNLMANTRTNSDYWKAKSAGNVDNEILVQYQKLKKMTKMPIPEPSEILANPVEYKPIIASVLGNPLMKQQKTHPYVKYFTLIAEKLGLQVPTNDFNQPNIEQMMNSDVSSELKQINGNSINTDGDETDSDSDDDADIEV